MEKLKKKKKTIVVVIVGVVILLAAGMLVKNVLSGKKKDASGLTQSYEVTTGSVDSTVSATGNISMDDTKDIVVSTGVIVKEVLVEAGDEVKKGDILARLDKTSVVSELIEAKETKEDLEDQLDDDLSDLEIEKIKGEIEEISDRIKDLNKLHENPVIKASVSGTVASVNVYAGGEITNTGAGSGTSTDSTQTTGSVSGSYTSTAQTNHTNMTASTAKNSGTGNYKASFISLASPLATVSYSSDQTKTSSQVVAAKMSTQEAEAEAAEDSGDGSEGGNEDSGNKEGDSGNKEDSGSGDKEDSGSGGEEGSDKKDEDKKEDSNKDDSKKDDSKKDNNKNSDDSKVITDISSVQITAPVTGNKPQTSVSGGEGFSASISWSPSGSTFAPDTSYTATVILTAKDGYIFRGSYQEASVHNGGKQLKITRTYDKTASAGSSTGNPTGSTKAGSGATTQAKKGTVPSMSGSKGSGASASAAGSSSSGGGTTEFYGTYKAAAFSISTRKDISIVVSIDELDILSIEKGQTAKVTLDALPDEEIEGTISKISNTATTNNGNTKYNVEISIPDNEQIMDGMSASVVIVTDSAQDAVLIPVLALNERGDKQYVYTSQDSKGNLSGEVEVETGLSDGTNVAITSGLSAGDTIYYQIVSGDDFTKMMNGNMPGGGGMNGGPPSGGDGPPAGFNGGRPGGGN